MVALLMAVMLFGTALVPQLGLADEPDGGSSKIQVSFGPEEIWQPSDTALQALFGCQPQPTVTCVRQVMEGDGATPDAVAFYGLTGWFLSDIMDTTPVRVATIMTPWRANENSQWALVGGVPAVIYPEQGVPTHEAEDSAVFQQIKAGHPNAWFWPSGPALNRVDASPQGGQRFIFNYRVLDGCHACAVLGYVPVGFDFGPDGTFFSARVLADAVGS
jgi:hypothetical protein